MKEFHTLVHFSCIDKKWLLSLLKESQREIWAKECTSYTAGRFFDRVFNLDMDMEEVDRLGKFIKSGEYARFLDE